MALRRVFALGLLVVVAVLGTLAHCSPPDPTWLTGFWDDADADDVMVLIACTVGVVGPLGSTDAHPDPVASPCQARPWRAVAGRAVASSNPVRAPPVS